MSTGQPATVLVSGAGGLAAQEPVQVELAKGAENVPLGRHVKLPVPAVGAILSLMECIDPTATKAAVDCVASQAAGPTDQLNLLPIGEVQCVMLQLEPVMLN